MSNLSLFVVIVSAHLLGPLFLHHLQQMSKIRSNLFHGMVNISAIILFNMLVLAFSGFMTSFNVEFFSAYYTFTCLAAPLIILYLLIKEVGIEEEREKLQLLISVTLGTFSVRHAFFNIYDYNISELMHHNKEAMIIMFMLVVSYALFSNINEREIAF